MGPRDLGQQGARLATLRGFRAGHVSHNSPRRDAHHIEHDANRKRLALVLDETEFHFGASEKMRKVFFKISRSMRRRSFSRRRRAFSPVKSLPPGGIAACVLERRGDPACPPPFLCQARNRAAGIPSSPAIWLSGRPLLASSPKPPA